MTNFYNHIKCSESFLLMVLISSVGKLRNSTICTSLQNPNELITQANIVPRDV